MEMEHLAAKLSNLIRIYAGKEWECNLHDISGSNIQSRYVRIATTRNLRRCTPISTHFSVDKYFEEIDKWREKKQKESLHG